MVNDWNRLGKHTVNAESIGCFKDSWMRAWIGMTDDMDKYWGEKELSRVGHQLTSCSLIILMLSSCE